MPSSRKPHPATLARELYGGSLDVTSERDLDNAMSDFCTLDFASQQFVIAHLLYLNLQASRLQQRTLDDLADSCADLVELGDEFVEAPDDEEVSDDALLEVEDEPQAAASPPEDLAEPEGGEE